MSTRVDLPPACAAFVAVAHEQSFTAGAATLGVPQPVISRRVAALERTLGGPLLERSTRRVTLTGLGRRVLPSAEQLAKAADELVEVAQRHRSRSLVVSVPDVLDLAETAALCSACEAAGVRAEVRADDPAERLRLLETDLVQIAVIAVPADIARWSSPLGVTGARGETAPFRLSHLRAGRRGAGRPPTLWATPEDDVAHVRDPLLRARDRHGLGPSQVRWDTPLVGLQHVLAGPDRMLATPADARRYGLGWRPLADVDLRRAHTLRACTDDAGAAAAVSPLIGAVLHPSEDRGAGPSDA